MIIFLCIKQQNIVLVNSYIQHLRATRACEISVNFSPCEFLVKVGIFSETHHEVVYFSP